MKWEELSHIDQLIQLDKGSESKPAVIFKHSTRCSINDAAISRFDRDWGLTDAEKMTPYYLDLIAHRDISNAIAQRYGITHESPQVLIIKNGKCVYDESHMNIRVSDIRAQL